MSDNLRERVSRAMMKLDGLLITDPPTTYYLFRAERLIEEAALLTPAPSEAGLRELLARIKGLSDSLNDRHPSIAKEIRDLSAGLALAAPAEEKGERWVCQKCKNVFANNPGVHYIGRKQCFGPVVVESEGGVK